MKKRFLDSLPSDWVKYLVVIIVSVLLWVWVFGLYHAPKDSEKLEVFYAGVVKDYTFEEVAADALPGVKTVSVSSAYPWTGNSFEQKYSLVALTASDVVIVPEEVAVETECKRAFEPIEGIAGKAFVQEGVQYGVYLSEEAKQALGAYLEFEYDEYVVFAVAASMNSGQVTDHSFKLIEWLVG